MTATNPKTPKASAAAAVAKAEPIVTLADLDIALPPKPTRSGTGKSKYPFADLAVGKFFSVKNKDRRSMASALANANKRYRNELKLPDGGKQVVQEREFYAVDVDAEIAGALAGSPHEGATVLVIRSK